MSTDLAGGGMPEVPADVGGGDGFISSGPAGTQSGPQSYDSEVSESPQHQPAPPSRPAQPRVNGQFARQPQQPKAPQPAQPPQSWPAHIREQVWSRLEPEHQQHFATTEAERHRAFTENGERLKSYEPFDQLAQSYKADFARHGIESPAQAFHLLLEGQRALDANAPAAIAHLMRSYGIRPEQLLPEGYVAQPVQQRLHELQQRNGVMQQQFAEITKQLQAAKAGEAEAKAELARMRHAQDAARSARVNVRSSGSAAHVGPKTIDDTIKDAAARAYGV
jgi:hypothetical protein